MGDCSKNARRVRGFINFALQISQILRRGFNFKNISIHQHILNMLHSRKTVWFSDALQKQETDQSDVLPWSGVLEVRKRRNI
jgi:hypothetical protein